VSGTFSVLESAGVVLVGDGDSEGLAEAEGVALLVGEAASDGFGVALGVVATVALGVVETVGVLGVQETATTERLVAIANL